jgi:hypothetical protein
MKKNSMNYGGSNQSIKPESFDTMRPIVALGVKRVFNRDGEFVNGSRRDDHPHEDHEYAYMNVQKEEGSFMNAVSLEIDVEDLEKTIKREIGYDLVPVVFK